MPKCKFKSTEIILQFSECHYCTPTNRLPVVNFWSHTRTHTLLKCCAPDSNHITFQNNNELNIRNIGAMVSSSLGYNRIVNAHELKSALLVNGAKKSNNKKRTHTKPKWDYFMQIKIWICFWLWFLFPFPSYTQSLFFSYRSEMLLEHRPLSEFFYEWVGVSVWISICNIFHVVNIRSNKHYYTLLWPLRCATRMRWMYLLPDVCTLTSRRRTFFSISRLLREMWCEFDLTLGLCAAVFIAVYCFYFHLSVFAIAPFVVSMLIFTRISPRERRTYRAFATSCS